MKYLIILALLLAGCGEKAMTKALWLEESISDIGDKFSEGYIVKKALRGELKNIPEGHMRQWAGSSKNNLDFYVYKYPCGHFSGFDELVIYGEWITYKEGERSWVWPPRIRRYERQWSCNYKL